MTDEQKLLAIISAQIYCWALHPGNANRHMTTTWSTNLAADLIRRAKQWAQCGQESDQQSQD